MESMYVNINKKWFEENKQRFEDNADEEGYYLIMDDTNSEYDITCSKVEVTDIEPEYGVSLLQNDINKNIYVGLDWKPEAQEVAAIVEQELDNISGDSLTKIIELVVKKLNKFRSFIESIKGL